MTCTNRSFNWHTVETPVDLTVLKERGFHSLISSCSITFLNRKNPKTNKRFWQKKKIEIK